MFSDIEEKFDDIEKSLIERAVPATLIPIDVPMSFRWYKLSDSAYTSLREILLKEGADTLFLDKYATLIRIQSWAFGLDWDVKDNLISIPIPNNFIDYEGTTSDGKRIDGLTMILMAIINKASVKTVYPYFDEEELQ